LLPLYRRHRVGGLSDEGKANMLSWAAGIFNAFGPDTHQRTLSGIAIMQQGIRLPSRVDTRVARSQRMGAALFGAADRGEVSTESAKAMLMDYSRRRSIPRSMRRAVRYGSLRVTLSNGQKLKEDPR